MKMEKIEEKIRKKILRVLCVRSGSGVV